MKATALALTVLLGAVIGCDAGRSLSPPPPIEWTSPLSVRGSHMVRARDGNVAVCGCRPTNDVGEIPAILVVDGYGRELWSREYGALNLRSFEWIDATADGGFVAVGSTGAWASNESDIGVARFDPKGEVHWSKTHGGPAGEHGSSIAETREGDLIVCGLTVSYGAGKSDAYLLRLDASGRMVWERRLGEDGYHCVLDLREGPDGGCIALCSGPDRAAYLVKLGGETRRAGG